MDDTTIFYVRLVRAFKTILLEDSLKTLAPYSGSGFDFYKNLMTYLRNPFLFPSKPFKVTHVPFTNFLLIFTL